MYWVLGAGTTAFVFWVCGLRVLGGSGYRLVG